MGKDTNFYIEKPFIQRWSGLGLEHCQRWGGSTQAAIISPIYNCFQKNLLCDEDALWWTTYTGRQCCLKEEDWRGPLGGLHLHALKILALEDFYWLEMELNCLSYRGSRRMTGTFNFQRFHFRHSQSPSSVPARSPPSVVVHHHHQWWFVITISAVMDGPSTSFVFWIIYHRHQRWFVIITTTTITSSIINIAVLRIMCWCQCSLQGILPLPFSGFQCTLASALGDSDGDETMTTTMTMAFIISFIMFQSGLGKDEAQNCPASITQSCR